MYDSLQPLALLTHWFLRFLLLLFIRHWMIGVVNIILTASLGIGLIHVAERWQFLHLHPQSSLKLRRFVLLTSISKGALYLVTGESMHAAPGFHWVAGFQFPGPAETAGLLAQTGYSIWHPTELSHWVILALSGLATSALLFRLTQLLVVRSSFSLWTKLSTKSTDNRLDNLLVKAAYHMELPYGTLLPAIFDIDLPNMGRFFHTPFLVGLWSPLLLIPRRLLLALPDAELELVLRHELAHFIRRDHWWRWFLLWIVDVAAFTLLVFPLKAAIIEIEEQLCDRQAVYSPHEALLLARALQAVANTPNVASKANTEATASDWAYNKPFVSAAQIGRYFGKSTIRHLNATSLRHLVQLLISSYVSSWYTSRTLQRRLQGLLALSQELSLQRTARDNFQGLPQRKAFQFSAAFLQQSISTLTLQFIRMVCWCLFSFLLLAVLYAKFYLTLNLR